MPDPQYLPDDPRYYSVRDKFGNMGTLVQSKAHPTKYR